MDDGKIDSITGDPIEEKELGPDGVQGEEDEEEEEMGYSESDTE